MFDVVLKRIFGTKHEREIKRLQPMVQRIAQLEEGMKRLSEAELKGQTAKFRERIARGESLDELLPEAFATCREGASRALGMRHYDVQMIGGMVLHEGKIAEMKTGEGKTLVATLACYLNALAGKGVHVVTVNDYLARRDAEWMGQLYGYLGLSTGIIVPQQPDGEKKRAYAADITYGQNNEFGFDYLRDNMKFSIYDYAQRDLNFAIVDEVDSILIDEARTPLIISGPGETASEKYLRINAIIPRFIQDEHYILDEKARTVTLTEEGNAHAQTLLHEAGLLASGNLYDIENLESLHIFQQCLRAHALYHRDQQYMVAPDGRVLIIDEFTGRVLPGRRWSEGLHQAIEAKERVAIQDENITLATISFQNLFRLYNKLSGMTGTADTEASEFHKIYKLDVVVIPTNKPIQRQDNEDLVYKSEAEKFKAVAAELEACHKREQPVLVGTTSVEKSDVLSTILDARGIPHQVLNAKQHENEAYVVAQAGRPGAVTVATNMAGRGTDIVLGGNAEMLARIDVLRRQDEALATDSEAFREAVEEATAQYKASCEADKRRVLEAGGLHIVGTERHESRRIDNQLRGRSGRQGDPGASRFYLSLEDDLMRIFAGERLQVMMDRLGMEEDIPIEHRWVTRSVENAQKKVEERNFDIRKNMLEYDDVLNQQRVSVYTLRRQILTGQYCSMLSEEERHAGKEPERYVKEADASIRTEVEKTLGEMVRFHAADVSPTEQDPEIIRAAQAKALKAPLESLSSLRVAALEQDAYVWFGVRLELAAFAEDPAGAHAHLLEQVSFGLTEQRERLFDLADELLVALVQRHCPANRSYEDWDTVALGEAVAESFAIKVGDLTNISERQELVEKLYGDVEGVLRRKFKDFGLEHFLRLFRNFYMQEIDRRWIEHLQHMDQLRDGIGLRGYGQRDPKKEYKKEGYELFVRLMQDIRSAVMKAMMSVERVQEEDLERVEAERRAQAAKRQAQADVAARAQAKPSGQPAAGASGTHRRDQPKVGRNDPCPCGSGKKYKQCHALSDAQAV